MLGGGHPKPKLTINQVAALYASTMARLKRVTDRGYKHDGDREHAERLRERLQAYDLELMEYTSRRIRQLEGRE